MGEAAAEELEADGVHEVEDAGGAVGVPPGGGEVGEVVYFGGVGG